ncbi:MAG TPA: hypothetical protein VFO81_00200, partial [Gaiellaceae bacterium]|nr:hypothetical protein [Gaiellaceae bacterium]
SANSRLFSSIRETRGTSSPNAPADCRSRRTVGPLEELDQSQRESDYQGLRETIDSLVDAVIANGVYEVVVTWTAGDDSGG